MQPRRAPRSISLFVGLALICMFGILAALAPVLAPPQDAEHPYRIPREGYRFEPSPPAPGHPFGTTADQYDIFYGVVWGTRTAFKVGLMLPAITLLTGLVVGSASAFIGGRVDRVMQRGVEVFMSFPLVVGALTLGSILTPRLHDRQLSSLIALAAFGWTSYARLVRGEVLAIKRRDYVLAAQVTGASPARILVRHILPNALSPLYVLAALDIGTSVLIFSGLSFLGLGSAEDYADWGSLLSSARNWLPDLLNYWYVVAFPGSALLLFSLAWNLVADALRDALDPRLR